MKPTRQQVFDHLREHYGLPTQDLIAILNTPMHPRELRDEFAVKAMQSIITATAYRKPSLNVFGAQQFVLSSNERIAEIAYKAADAMLEVRAAK